jgi:hypothetical protein
MSGEGRGNASENPPERGFLRARLPALVLEAAMVVFAVLVALGVEEWREERQRAEFADRVRASVEREVEANIEELRTTAPELQRAVERMAEALRADDVSLLSGTVSMTLPDFSSAAWRAAQSSEAARDLDYDWLIGVSRAYEAYDMYRNIGDALVDKMGDFMVGEPTLDEIAAVQGRLLVLVTVHGQVLERLENVAAAEEADLAAPGS